MRIARSEKPNEPAQARASFGAARRVFIDPFRIDAARDERGWRGTVSRYRSRRAQLVMVVAHAVRGSEEAFGLFQSGGLLGMSGSSMKTKRNKAPAVRVPKRLPRRGEAARIDTSDIAPLTAEFFSKAVRNPFYRPIKRSTTVRLDADVLGWLKAQGPGYQTRINALLRKAMYRAAKEKGDLPIWRSKGKCH